MLSLEDLAHEKSSDKRRELLNRITGMFLNGAENHSDRESALYAEVALQVLDEITADDRAEYSDAVAHEARVPGDVVRRLAGDEIVVALPVLARSPVLSDDDLVQVAQSSSQEHLQAISIRDKLSESVTDALVDRGDRKVVCSVTINPGARFSDSGLTKITQQSADDEEMRSNLLSRADLRAQLVEKVLPLVSADYSEQLRGMIESADDTLIDRVVNAAETTVENDRSNAARRRLETRMMLKELKGGLRRVDDTLVYLSDQARITDIVTILGRLTDMADNVVSNVMFKPDNEPVAILVRAAGASQIGFKAIQSLRAQKLRLPQSHLERGMRNFAELDESTAKRSLRFVKLRSEVA
jgi:hypothetical protein